MALTEHMGKLLDAAHEAYVRAYGRTLVQFGYRHAMGIKAAVEAVLAEQARAAEQGQERSSNENQSDVCMVRPVDRGVLGQEKSNPVPVSVADGCAGNQITQPAAGDVVERVMSRGCPISCSNDLGHSYTCLREHVTAALAVAREGYVSLEDVLDSLSKNEIAEIEHIFGDCSKQQIDYLISSRRARLSKPAERVTVEHYLKNPDRWIVLLDGANPASSYFYSIKDANRYAAGLREELKAGKQ